MGGWIREALGRRPWWMNALMLFCLFMAALYTPWDFFLKPAGRDEEAWFGFVLTGAWAKATEPLHWAVFTAGTYGFWRMRRWMWPWAAVYAAQVAASMIVWGAYHEGGFRGLALGVLFGLPAGVSAAALWQARERFRAPQPPLRARYGPWALVTGASAGIGLEFARALAREGMSCVLTARREDRLRELSAELEREFGVSTRVLALDLSHADGADRLARAVEDLEIGLLVNNAGVGLAGRFDKQDVERLRALVTLNCTAPVVLTRRLLPAMLGRGRGAVVIVGSVAGRQPVPLHGVYSATKAFDSSFGEALWAELRGTGIDVLVLEPGVTATEFQTVSGELAHGGEPAARVVRVALDALGQQLSVISGWFNWIRAQGVRLAPRAVAVLMARAVMRRWVPPDMR